MNDQTKHDGQQRLPNPVAWVRFCSDGGIEGPILDNDSRMEGVRRTSGAWTPLYTAQPEPVNQQLLAALFNEALSWGATYGPTLKATQWHEMRQKMVEQYCSRAIAAEAAHQVVKVDRRDNDAGATWVEAQRICDLPTVDEAIRAFVDDHTGDNATAIIATVLEALHHQQPASAQPVAVPDGARHWAYRHYGSEPQKGYTIVSRAAGATHGGTPVAYLGDGELAGDAVQAICEAHNAALAAVAVPDEIDADKAPWASAEMEPDIAYADGWNACRAAMLSAAQKGGAA